MCGSCLAVRKGTKNASLNKNTEQIKPPRIFRPQQYEHTAPARSCCLHLTRSHARNRHQVQVNRMPSAPHTQPAGCLGAMHTSVSHQQHRATTLLHLPPGKGSQSSLSTSGLEELPVKLPPISAIQFPAQLCPCYAHQNLQLPHVPHPDFYILFDNLTYSFTTSFLQVHKHSPKEHSLWPPPNAPSHPMPSKRRLYRRLLKAANSAVGTNTLEACTKKPFSFASCHCKTSALQVRRGFVCFSSVSRVLLYRQQRRGSSSSSRSC